MTLFRHRPQPVQERAEIGRKQGEFRDKGRLAPIPQRRSEIPGFWRCLGWREIRSQAGDLVNLGITTRSGPLETDVNFASRRALGTNLQAGRYKFGVQNREDEGVYGRAIRCGETQSAAGARYRMQAEDRLRDHPETAERPSSQFRQVVAGNVFYDLAAAFCDRAVR